MPFHAMEAVALATARNWQHFLQGGAGGLIGDCRRISEARRCLPLSFIGDSAPTRSFFSSATVPMGGSRSASLQFSGRCAAVG